MSTNTQMTGAGVAVALNALAAVVTHLAIGTGNAPVTGNETALAAEVARVGVTGFSVIENTLYLDFYVASGLAKVFWQEVGVVSNGTDAAGTGTLITRHLLKYDKAGVNEAATVSVEIPLTAM